MKFIHVTSGLSAAIFGVGFILFTMIPIVTATSSTTETDAGAVWMAVAFAAVCGILALISVAGIVVDIIHAKSA